ncbi:unnamed protein product [Ceratitis capitata]|uniref:UBX domain-containing protein 4 n=1 Tax=Ceratitis capitata TaxID=7213 RepID=W8BIZ5_CERCA|nr:unnamed protein product [Ceratitis capitata]
MNWYKGNIQEAVAESKAKNAVFVVYVEGKNESTQKLTSFINDQKIREKLESDDFVAIKIESDSQAYMQFASIYQVVPVPSIFFIGKTGSPLEIGTGIIASVAELEEKIMRVLSASGRSTPSAQSSASFITAEQNATAVNSEISTKKSNESLADSGDVEAPSTSKPPAEPETVVKKDQVAEIVCEGDVCYKKIQDPQKEVAVATDENKVSTNETETKKETEANARLEEDRKKIEERRKHNEEQEQLLTERRLMRRRREEIEKQNLQKWQREEELNELKENIRREKLEEIAARDRIRAQIAADRAERAHKYSLPSAAIADVSNKSEIVTSTCSADSTRIQFRFANGNSATHVFESKDTLGKLREYVRTDLLPGTGIKDFTLATTYPKRELNVEHDVQTLAELNLLPSAVILIIGKESMSSPAAIIARSGGILNIFTTLVMTILSPVFSIFGYLKNVATGAGRKNDNDDGNNVGANKRANEDDRAQHDAAKRRNMERFGGSNFGNNASTSDDGATEKGESKPYRRYGGSNIHRLTDHKDSDDENATWNGNSTQQQ